MVSISYAQGKRSAVTSPVGIWSYSYNSQTGQLAGIDAPGGQSLSFERDGALLTQTQWSGPVVGTVSGGYDDSFRLTEQSVNGNAIGFTYDADSLLTGAGALTIDRADDHQGVTGTTLGTITTSRRYNAFGELSERTAEADGTVLYETDYQRDEAGRITGENSRVEGSGTDYTYGYDDAGRLTEVRSGGPAMHTYAYDDNGNRTSHTGPEGTTTADYDARDRLTRYGDTDYSYNAAGDLVSKTGPEGTTSYDYDALGNLRGVNLGDSTQIDYVIDGKHRRVGKKVNGTLEKGWLYQDELNPVAQTDGEGNITHRFIYGDKPNVPAYMTKDGTTYRIISDHLGSVRLVVNASTGEVVQRMDYGPFGKVTEDTNPGFQPFGFAGGLYDPDIGLVRFGARDYDAETGRWTARDPILFGGNQANLYGYSLNNPLNLTDPLGLAPCGDSPFSSWQDFKDFLSEHGIGSVSFSAGNGLLGVTGQVFVTSSGIHAYFGGGWGLGFGASMTGGVKSGNFSGFGGMVSGSSGQGLGAHGSVGVSQGGSFASGGAGVATGGGIAATGGYAGTVVSF